MRFTRSRSRTRPFVAGLATGSLVSLAQLASVPEAHAAPCGRPDVDLTFPPNAATGVPNNALLSAHYASPALYASEPVSLTDASGNEVELDAAYDEADSMLRATPGAALAAGAYSLVWPGLRGLSGGGGRGSTVAFTVSGSADQTPPSFAGLVDIQWDLARDRDPCLDKLDDRFVFRLKLGDIADDAGADLLSLLVFETKDPSTADQSEPNRVALRPFPGAGGTLEVRRPAQKAGRTCFAAIAQDLVGSVSGGGEREVCIKTRKPPFFDGCALVLAPAPRFGAGAGSLLGLLWLGLLRRGRRAAQQSTSLV